MIKCEDFALRITERGSFGGPSEYESFSEVVSAVNQWIKSRTIQVINVETVVLPDRVELEFRLTRSDSASLSGAQVYERDFLGKSNDKLAQQR